MSVIGEQIKKFRIQKNYTQEKLGSLIGVTTQAVSKWERGSSPDAEILPLIADVLEVSIDALYGREDQDIKKTLVKKLSGMQCDEAFREAFGFCMSVFLGLSGESDFNEDFGDSLSGLTDAESDRSTDYFTNITRDAGVVYARLSNDFSHYFLMVQPKNESVLAHLESEEDIRQVFALLSDKKILGIIYFLYKMPGIPATAALISDKTGLDRREVERLMKTLCEKQIVHHAKIASLDGEIDSYIIRYEANILPLLCYADVLAKGSPFPIFGICDRNKPVF